jgi:hypothetical protein
MSELRVSPASDPNMTVYTKYGDWVLALPCAILTIIIVLLCLARGMSGKRDCTMA